MTTTTQLLRTNSKQVKTAIQSYILDCIDLSEQDYNNDTDKGKIQFLMDEFKRVSCFEYNIRRLGTYQACFKDFMQGLPSYFNVEFYTDSILEKMASFGLPLPSNKTETEGENLYYALIYINFLDLCKKYNVTLF